ncbi:prohibitin family protein [Candidatus Dojkabacteria bacterium]|jgi:regulator of protease activity HflC (stomatin/prohibitin superfamily)|nr:prohibitin family protein [Candidatus Dojkabacteria bacterium]
MSYFVNESTNEPKFGKIISLSVAFVVIVILVFGSFGTVKAGEVGVRTTLGAVTGIEQPGFYLKLPFIQHMNKINVKTQTINYDRNGNEGDERDTSELAGASKDLQDVKIGVVVNYHINANTAEKIFVQYRSTENFELNVIEPIIRETVKSTSAQYTAEELVTKRAEYSDKVNISLIEKFATKDAVLERFSVTNFEFSPAFTQAIEAKVTAVQNAEAAKNKLEQIKFEAQQTIETAKASAEAIRISAQAINSQGGADYVNLKAVEKWDGRLPTQMIPGSAVPFVNLNK